jgi:hypothetical protein
LIPAMAGRECQVANQVAGILYPLGLEPGQRNQILSAINQALENLENSLTPLHLRISISGVALEEMLHGSTLDRQKVLELATKGLGFFLVKRIVDQVPDQGSEKYRLLEVLIYRE